MVAELATVAAPWPVHKLRVTLVDLEGGALPRIEGLVASVAHGGGVDAPKVVARPLWPSEQLMRLWWSLVDVLAEQPVARLLQHEVVFGVDKDNVGVAAVPRCPLHHKGGIRIHLPKRQPCAMSTCMQHVSWVE